MTSLVLREVARWVRALGAPLTVLATVVVTPILLPGATEVVLKVVPTRVASLVWMAGGAATLVWLLASGVRATLQSAQDERAAGQLQGLRDQSALPRHTLVCVLGTLWTSPAGQRIAAVDTRSGQIREFWLAEDAVDPGTFLLLGGTPAGIQLIDQIDAHEIAAARRHERDSEARRRVNLLHAARLARRTGRKAAADVVRAAEELLR